jgi:hypothetical protein
MWHVWGEKRNLKERDYLEDLRVCGKIVLKWSLKIGW